MAALSPAERAERARARAAARAAAQAEADRAAVNRAVAAFAPLTAEQLAELRLLLAPDAEL